MQHFTVTELKSLVNEVRQPRSKLMILTGYWHGLRASELCGMKATNIKDGFVNVRRLKGSLKTIQPFVVHADPVLDESKGLTELAASLKSSDLVFPMTRSGFYRLIQRAGSRAGIPKHKLHPHALKHSIAMHTIKGAGIENVRQWLGHKSMSSTGAYLRVTDEAAAAAIQSTVGVTV